MLSPTSVWTTIVLAAAVALGPLAIDLYLPAMPMMQDALATDSSQIQLTLSVYLVGFAFAQLVCGPLADRFGRKPVMVTGLILFAIASVGCAMASSIESLLTFRFLQALGGSAGPVLGRAAVRDIYQPREAAKIMAMLASIMALAPAVAPALGGLLAVVAGWSSLFLALGAYALVVAVIVAIFMREPLPQDRRQAFNPSTLLRNYRHVLADASFLGYALTNSFTFAGLFAFLSGSSFVLIDFLGVPAERYGLLFACVVVGYIVGNLITLRLARTLSPDQLLLRGLLIAVAGGVAAAMLALNHVFSVWSVILPQVVFMIGVGMTLPQTMAGALANFPTMAGSASALFGAIQMAIAATVGGLVGLFHSGSPLTMAVVIALCALAALTVYALIVQRHPAPGFEPA